MKSCNTLKIFSTLIFFIGMVFVCCLFLESWHSVFFFNSNYKLLKVILSFVIPSVLTSLYVLINKDFSGLKIAIPIIAIVFIVHYYVDTSFIGYIAMFGDFCIIFHLVYATIAFFTVITVASVIKMLFMKNNENDDFLNFYKWFLYSFTIIIAFDFILMFFAYRTSNADLYLKNIVPFNGEIKTFIEAYQLKSILGIIHSLGNVFFFVPLEFVVLSFLKGKNKIIGLVIPIALSVIIELSQYILKNGSPDIDDVILNTFGSIIGLIFYLIFFKKVWEDKKCLE